MYKVPPPNGQGRSCFGWNTTTQGVEEETQESPKVADQSKVWYRYPLL